MNNKKKKQIEADYNKILKDLEKKYGSKETNNFQLLKIGKKLFGNRFKGVYASDRIPVLKKGEFSIVNLDDSNKPGSHWIAIARENNKMSYIYDSFGRKTYKILPELFQSGNGIVLETENDAEQNESEENCGQRCLSALMIYKKYGGQGFKYI